MPTIYKPKSHNLPAKFVAGFLSTMDQRTDLAKRLNHAYRNVVDDAGGVDNLPYAKVCLCERFAFLEEFLRQIELQLIEDPKKLPDLLTKWVQAVNFMVSLSRTLGIGDKKHDAIFEALYKDDPEDDE